MSESEKRAERLKAMRLEASQYAASSRSIPSPSSGSLASPLLEPSVLQSGEKSPDGARFDYYTDPLSAFSGIKRRNKGQSPHGNHSSLNNTQPGLFTPAVTTETRSPGASVSSSTADTPKKLNRTCLTDQRPYMMLRPNMIPPTWRNMIGIENSFSSTWGGLPGCSPSGNANDGWSGAVMKSDTSPLYTQGIRLLSGDSGKRASTYVRSPVIEAGRGKERSPCFSSPTASAGSARGCSPHMSGGSSGRVGRGRGKNHGSMFTNVLAKEKPELFFMRSMVEDPWRDLKPVIGGPYGPVSSPATPSSCQSWIPSSVRMKGTKSPVNPVNFTFQSSIAECLDDSLDETLNNCS